MATPIKDWSKLEIRAVVRFLCIKGRNPSQICSDIVEPMARMLCQSLGSTNYVLGSKAYIQVWKMSPGLAARQLKKNKEKFARVDELFKSDRRVKIREVALKFEILKSTCL